MRNVSTTRQGFVLALFIETRLVLQFKWIMNQLTQLTQCLNGVKSYLDVYSLCPVLVFVLDLAYP